MTFRGINYDTGTEYRAGESSRAVFNHDDVARDLRVIRRELHCTSVNVYGTTLDRLMQAARLAHGETSRATACLDDVVAAARARFAGRVTYSAGAWESVRWDAFDVVARHYQRLAR